MLSISYLKSQRYNYKIRFMRSFTDFDDQSVSGIFEPGDVEELVKAINDVEARASA